MVRGIRDSQDLLSGKWKLLILSVLSFRGETRFLELSRALDGISPKVLSKELKDLEVNNLVDRVIKETRPITVEYKLTDLGNSLLPIIESMANWGRSNRQNLKSTELRG